MKKTKDSSARMDLSYGYSVMLGLVLLTKPSVKSFRHPEMVARPAVATVGVAQSLIRTMRSKAKPESTT
jgi:hypothetical protein